VPLGQNSYPDDSIPHTITDVGGCHRRPEPELTGERSFRALPSVPPLSSLTILSRRLGLEAYTCGSLYVRLGGEKGRDWMIGEGRAMRATKRANSVTKRTAGVGMLLCAFLATQATAHAAEGRLSPNHLAHHLVVGLLCAGGVFVWDCVQRKGRK
jgi:hypothetical protein